MKINGCSFQCEHLFFVYFRKHFCPCCGERLVRQRVSEIVRSDSAEAKNHDFEVADITVRGNMKFTRIEFFCPGCRKNYTVRDIREGKK